MRRGTEAVQSTCQAFSFSETLRNVNLDAEYLLDVVKHSRFPAFGWRKRYGGGSALLAA
jgi:hypothetical protein